jgi:hypothetical protein
MGVDKGVFDYVESILVRTGGGRAYGIFVGAGASAMGIV